jgi:hypothetical protein
MNTETMSKPIRNIHALNRHIRELKERQKVLETQMSQNFENLRGNYVGMTMNSIIGGKRQSTNFWAEVVTRVMESEKLQKGVSSLVGKMADKIGEAFH